MVDDEPPAGSGDGRALDHLTGDGICRARSTGRARRTTVEALRAAPSGAPHASRTLARLRIPGRRQVCQIHRTFRNRPLPAELRTARTDGSWLEPVCAGIRHLLCSIGLPPAGLIFHCSPRTVRKSVTQRGVREDRSAKTTPGDTSTTPGGSARGWPSRVPTRYTNWTALCWRAAADGSVAQPLADEAEQHARNRG